MIKTVKRSSHSARINRCLNCFPRDFPCLDEKWIWAKNKRKKNKTHLGSQTESYNWIQNSESLFCALFSSVAVWFCVLNIECLISQESFLGQSFYVPFLEMYLVLKSLWWTPTLMYESQPPGEAWRPPQFTAIFRLLRSVPLDKMATLESRLWHYNLLSPVPLPNSALLKLRPQISQEFPNTELAILLINNWWNVH